MSKPPPLPAITISGDIGIIAGIALTEYANDQKTKGYLFTAASVYRDAAEIFRKLGRVDTAEFYDGVSATTLVAAYAADAAKTLSNLGNFP